MNWSDPQKSGTQAEFERIEQQANDLANALEGLTKEIKKVQGPQRDSGKHQQNHREKFKCPDQGF